MGLELNKHIEWSLTWQARAAIHQLKQRWQLDEDFALTLLEKIWPDYFIYELIEDDEASDNDTSIQGLSEGNPHGND